MANYKEEILEALETAFLQAEEPNDTWDVDEGQVLIHPEAVKEGLAHLINMEANDLLERGLALLEEALDEKEKDQQGPDLTLRHFSEGLAYLVSVYHDDDDFREALEEYETDILFQGDVVLDPPGFLKNLEQLSLIHI